MVTATAVAEAVLPTVASMAGAAMKRVAFPRATVTGSSAAVAAAGNTMTAWAVIEFGDDYENRHYREDDWDRYGYDERREPYFEDEERERRRERHRRMMDEYGDDGDGYD